MPSIEFRDLSVSFYDTPVLTDINLVLSEQRIGIIGANGGGKSTLTRLINGLGEPTKGQVLVDGVDVAKHGKDIRKKVGFVFSDAENQIVMPNVKDDVAFSLRRLKLPKEEVSTRVDAALQRFGLSALAEQSPHTLSGGQKQLLALAAVLVIDPVLIIADEPTTRLDLRNRDRIRREFADLNQQLIVVTHDLEFLSDFDRVVCIDQHRIAADGAPDEVTSFYRDLMASRPLQGN
ncbi:energy-coupling factor ABC transporter ATP-binding protein [Corynebacterium flavescens]|uniref:energy-coupling factor ABC transporter ATP-binding protein n=1 Tax=Corynebacterium flavescens TaxID=28028 RepID=UPI003FD45006